MRRLRRGASRGAGEARPLPATSSRRTPRRCGMERVRVYAEAPCPPATGRGAFASGAPRSPAAPSRRGGGAAQRSCRCARTSSSACSPTAACRTLFVGRWTVGDLVAFHTAEKLLLLAHDPERYRQLGPLVARAKGSAARGGRPDVRRDLHGGAGEARHARSPRERPAAHGGVLQGPRRTPTSAPSCRRRSAITGAGWCRSSCRSRSSRHHVRRHGVTYLAGQRYLEPHPKELMLRNHV